MSKLISALRAEPVRAILYPLLAILVGVLVTRGIVDQFSADIIIGIVGAVLGVPAAEAARAKVTPWPAAEMRHDR
ncbi:hypothetical protein LTT66_18380 [Nocardia gipuzkoensis]|uniref:phage holin n=1 Tax=Nocardia gipuzkoensis TaxID=2749991 RepID=UPI001E47A848|nr:hypothetical protein [Nocardia gipuzkoensis]UGT65338.1 hypothetical protein LTT66_18380 [Nocardia gipuzkoensis]